MKSCSTAERRCIGGLIPFVILALFVSCSSYQFPKSYGFSSVLTLKGHTEAVLDLDLSSDGRYLASAGKDDTVRVWDTETMEELGIIEGHPDDVFSVSFAPDTSFLATGCLDGAVRVYALPSGELVHPLKGHAETVYSVDVSPDGKQILSGGKDATVRYGRGDRGASQGLPGAQR
jgi:WD40 repeat protein